MKPLAQMVNALIASGLSQPDIARQADTSQATISRIINNNQNPGYEIGRRIETLYCEHCEPAEDSRERRKSDGVAHVHQ